MTDADRKPYQDWIAATGRVPLPLAEFAAHWGEGGSADLWQMEHDGWVSIYEDGIRLTTPRAPNEDALGSTDGA